MSLLCEPDVGYAQTLSEPAVVNGTTSLAPAVMTSFVFPEMIFADESALNTPRVNKQTNRVCVCFFCVCVLRLLLLSSCSPKKTTKVLHAALSELRLTLYIWRLNFHSTNDSNANISEYYYYYVIQ